LEILRACAPEFAPGAARRAHAAGRAGAAVKTDELQRLRPVGDHWNCVRAGTMSVHGPLKRCGPPSSSSLPLRQGERPTRRDDAAARCGAPASGCNPDLEGLDAAAAVGAAAMQGYADVKVGR
jgi:hypothetical protein